MEKMEEMGFKVHKGEDLIMNETISSLIISLEYQATKDLEECEVSYTK